MRYCLLPLGCQMNKSDAERIANVLENMGFIATEIEEEADILGIVACSVRQKSINRVYGRIQKWTHWKKEKNLFTFLSGCVLPADEEQLKFQFDLIFKINDLPKLPELIQNLFIEKKRKHIVQACNDFEDGFWKIKPKYSSSFQAFVPIQNGCNKFCTYCAVPYTRGREVSRNSSEILEEIFSLVNNGYKSITLLGQNVNSYGKDKAEEKTFAELLQSIGEFGQQTKKEFLVYYTSPHPSDMKSEVFEVMAKYPCIAKQIHLPIQSGDDTVLKRMNRSYTLEHYRQLIHDIHRILPTATIFTDIIVGFSGETEEQFQHTIDALREFEFDMAYIAQYSPRPGAKSATWEDDVPAEEKKRRFHDLTQALREVSLIRNQRMIGKTYRVLVEGLDPRNEGYFLAHTEGLIPVHFKETNQSLIGTFVDLKIESVTCFAGSGILV